MRGSYNTKQSQQILEYLQKNKSSVSAKEIYASLGAQGMNIGLATIYRQLENLVRELKVKKIVTDEGSMRFQFVEDFEATDSYFLKCDDCGTLIASNCHLLLEVSEHMSDEHGFQIDTGKSVLYGRCKNCRHSKLGE